MRNSTLTALALVTVLALPAQAKQAHSDSKTLAKAKTKTVAVAPAPAPVVRNICSSKITRSFLPPAPKVVAKAKAPAKPAVVAQAKPAPAAVGAAAMNALSVDGNAGSPTVDQPLPKGALARITAYWTDEDYYTSQHMSSTGVRLHEGHCAVDPSLIPYGSVVQIPGMGSYVAVDTGSAVVSRKAALGEAHTPDQRNALVVDLFFETRHEAEDFAAHGPSFVSVSWKPGTLAGAALNNRALPAGSETQTARVQVYVLASAPSLADSRLPLNFRSPIVFQ